jgi:hypothetical protein
MMTEVDFWKFAEMLERAFLVSGIVFLFLGFAGSIISVTFYNIGIFRDDVTSFAFGFVNAFMALLGIFLIMFHGKIIVKPKT